MEDEEAPGWDAIDSALAARHGSQEPIHLAPEALPGLGEASLSGISIYSVDGPIRHWHYVTYGMTELFEKESEDPNESGWGFEFTMRVKAVDEDPPDWPTRLLMRLADYVFESGSVFAPGHRMDPGSAIAPGSALTAIAFTKDPGLGELVSPFGAAHFLQVVGITKGELARMKASTTAEVLQSLAVNNELLVTDPDRGDGACQRK